MQNTEILRGFGDRLVAAVHDARAWVLGATAVCAGLAVVEPLAAQDALAPEDVIGKLMATAPEEDTFLLRATLPVPAQTFTGHEAETPLSVAGRDLRVFDTQIEIVSRYADAADGADVVELIAQVTRPPGTVKGDPLVFWVGRTPQPDGDFVYTEDVWNLVNTPGALKLRTRDVFGHVYSADIYESVRQMDPSARLRKDGELLREWSTHEVLMPNEVVEGAQGTLPHMMGVHAYVTAYRGEEFLTVDLHVHNGMDGLDHDDPADDALLNIYFEDLQLRLPHGWEVLHAFDSPYAGNTQHGANRNWTALVDRVGMSKMHVMGRQSRFIRRIAVVRTGDAEAHQRATETLESRYRGFSRRSPSPSGSDVWSWWNAETARYFPQNHVLPTLDHVGLHSIANGLRMELSEVEQLVRTGQSQSYPLTSPGLGWAHPWGAPYGGMTGGDEIYQFDGVTTAASASTHGYRLAQLVQRGYLDRQPTALYEADGRPCRLEDVLVPDGTYGPWIPMFFKLRPNLQNPEPFGFRQAPNFQTNAVRSAGRNPPYEAALLNFDPIDMQHYIRFTRNLKVLAWLGNDTLAKDQLEAAAEVCRMSFHQFRNSNYNHIQVSGLLQKMLDVEAAPNNGVGIGRGQAWAIDTNVAAYATGSPAFRARTLPWFVLIQELVEQGASRCRGHVMAQLAYNYYEGQLRVRQSFESGFLVNAMRGMSETVFRGMANARANSLQDVILGVAHAGVRPPFWDEGHTAPWFYIPVAPGDATQPEFCERYPGHSDNHDLTTFISVLAYGYELSGDDMFLFKASQMLGGGDILTQLEKAGLHNLQNTAGLLALCQGLTGH